MRMRGYSVRVRIRWILKKNQFNEIKLIRAIQSLLYTENTMIR